MPIVVEQSGDVTVTDGLVKRIRFPFNAFSLETYPIEYNILSFYDIEISVRVEDSKWLFVGYGRLDPRQPWSTPLKKYSEADIWYVDLLLQSSIIEYIESLRRPNYDAPVLFSFDWRMSYKVYSSRDGDYERTLENVRMYEKRQTVPSIHFTVTPQNWRNVLAAYGFGERKILEIVYPPTDRAKWQSAINYVAQAEQAFSAGRDNDVLANCESALEIVLGKEFGQSPTSEKLKTALSGLGVPTGSKFDLLVNLVLSTVKFIRNKKHDVSPSSERAFDAGGRDAELALNNTKALLGYLSK